MIFCDNNVVNKRLQCNNDEEINTNQRRMLRVALPAAVMLRNLFRSLENSQTIVPAAFSEGTESSGELKLSQLWSLSSPEARPMPMAMSLGATRLLHAETLR